jgi:ribonuclease HI
MHMFVTQSYMAQVQSDISAHTCHIKYVTIQWVPSHVGIHENEVADLLAKNGTTLYKSNQTLEAHQAKTIIKNKI